jgi:hypothetical protein
MELVLFDLYGAVAPRELLHAQRQERLDRSLHSTGPQARGWPGLAPNPAQEALPRPPVPSGGKGKGQSRLWRGAGVGARGMRGDEDPSKCQGQAGA